MNGMTREVNHDGKLPDPPQPKGMKDFCIDGVWVKAATRKAAIKKAKKRQL
jgi:hypothetical protein